MVVKVTAMFHVGQPEDTASITSAIREPWEIIEILIYMTQNLINYFTTVILN
jgi:hypothetical protein